MAFSKVHVFRNINYQLNLIAKRNSSLLKEKISCMIPKEIEKIKNFRKEHGKTKVGDVNVNMIYGGMRGILGLICETSEVDPDEGIRFRGYSIPDCEERLPKASCGEAPLPEGVFWLMATGEIPTDEEVKALSVNWAERAELPEHVENLLCAFPTDLHPMTQFSAALVALNKDSHFVNAYNKGVHKSKLWEHAYEDAMDLIAKEIVIAAKIYNNTFKNRKEIGDVSTDNDWSLNFCNLIHYEDTRFHELMRLYFTIHCDHEGGNVSAHACHLVGSAFSDPFLSFSAAMNGLAGPLHGLANQEVLLWIMQMNKELGEKASDEKVKEFILKTLKSGKVVPGYGHAVLRKTDPRYTCQQEFAKKHLEDDPLVHTVAQLYKIVPPVLKSLGKVQNPWPNVDAHSGVLLMHFGMKEMQYYTVLFGLSRALGVMAQYIWDRALGLPIERPKSIPTTSLMKKVQSLSTPKEKPKKEGDGDCKKGDSKKG